MMNELKLEQYYSSLFEIDYKNNDYDVPNQYLKERTVNFKIKDKSLFIKFELDQCNFLKTLDSIDNTNNIIINLYNKEGLVFMKMNLNCNISSSNLSKMDYSSHRTVKLKCKFNIHSMEIFEVVDTITRNIESKKLY